MGGWERGWGLHPAATAAAAKGFATAPHTKRGRSKCSTERSWACGAHHKRVLMLTEVVIDDLGQGRQAVGLQQAGGDRWGSR